MVNDCSHPKLSLNGVFLAGPLYTSKLSLQAYSIRVTAFARVEVALSTPCSRSCLGGKCQLRTSKLSLESDEHQVTALAFAELVLATPSRHSAGQLSP